MTAPDVSSVPTWYLERAINDTLPGLQNLVRDVWLAPSQAARYEVGSILRNPRPVDATSRVGGMRTSHRFAILSNRANDLSGLDEADRGLHSMAAPFGSTFQVVDVFEHAGKTQITLLHLPDDERWRLFDGVALSAVDDLLPGVRERFRAKCLTEPIPEVSSDEWLTHMHDPVGLDEQGEPYPVEVPLTERLRPLAETDFRDVAGRLLYVRGVAELVRMGDRALPDAVCYGYLDHKRGLCLNALCDAELSDGSIECGHAYDRIYIRLEHDPARQLEAADVCDAALFQAVAEPLGWVHDRYAAEEDEYRDLRDLAFLDQFRSPEYPDDVQGYLLAEGLRPELVWLRLEDMEEAEDGARVYAKLLNEPAQAYGVHEGDLLPLAFTDAGDGSVCLAIPERVG